MLFGAVGGPKWADVPYEHRPEAGLLRLRKDLKLFANLRPAICYPALADASSLKREVVEGLDILIVRELTGGVYFGEPKEIVTLENGQKRAVDTQVYTTSEIDRIARVAFDLAKTRRNKVSSAEKHNVMRSGVLWKQVVTEVAKDYPGVELEHVLADNCAMQLVRWPKQYDVLVCDNLFGDVLSDIAAMLTGSLGMLPSGLARRAGPGDGQAQGALRAGPRLRARHRGKGLANPIAMIGSFAMALRYSFGLIEAADLLDGAIADVLAAGVRTKDIAGPGVNTVGTQAWARRSSRRWRRGLSLWNVPARTPRRSLRCSASTRQDERHDVIPQGPGRDLEMGLLDRRGDDRRDLHREGDEDHQGQARHAQRQPEEPAYLVTQKDGGRALKSASELNERR